MQFPSFQDFFSQKFVDLVKICCFFTVMLFTLSVMKDFVNRKTRFFAGQKCQSQKKSKNVVQSSTEMKNSFRLAFSATWQDRVGPSLQSINTLFTF